MIRDGYIRNKILFQCNFNTEWHQETGSITTVILASRDWIDYYRDPNISETVVVFAGFRYHILQRDC